MKMMSISTPAMKFISASGIMQNLEIEMFTYYSIEVVININSVVIQHCINSKKHTTFHTDNHNHEWTFRVIFCMQDELKMYIRMIVHLQVKKSHIITQRYNYLHDQVMWNLDKSVCIVLNSCF
jgi:hypothetical protein